MKKGIIIVMLLSAGLAAGASDIGPAMGNLLNDVGTMQNTNAELKLMQEQRFRQEEYNEFQDMKQVKAARNKKIELEQEATQQRPRTYTNDVEFVRENGRLILKPIY